MVHLRGSFTKEFDGDIELVQMYDRWCSSQTGTFISHAPFPIALEHPYGYVRNLPAQMVDPEGRAWGPSIPTYQGPAPFGGNPWPTNAVRGLLNMCRHPFCPEGSPERFATAFQHPDYPGGMQPTGQSPPAQIAVGIAVGVGIGLAANAVISSETALNYADADTSRNAVEDFLWKKCDSKCKAVYCSP